MDNSIIRPEMGSQEVKLRRDSLTPRQSRELKKGVRTLHNLETMAVNIYKYQITREPSEHNRQLIAAMCNEMTPVQDFQVKLYEYGWNPSILQPFWWMVGIVFGVGSRVCGAKAMLKLGIWVESKAVHHYDELKQLAWDEDGLKIVVKDQADECEHITSWRQLLDEITKSQGDTK